LPAKYSGSFDDGSDVLVVVMDDRNSLSTFLEERGLRNTDYYDWVDWNKAKKFPLHPRKFDHVFTVPKEMAGLKIRFISGHR
jgi:hypothetical protein